MEMNEMSHQDDQWSFGDELYELRFWNLQLSSLEPKWQSAASDMLNYRKAPKNSQSDPTKRS
jgi:hypothetical protein